MGIGNPLSGEVLNLVEQWVPSEEYDHENKYQSELQDYLDEALNEQSGGLGLGMGTGGGGGHVVSTERGTSYGDVVVDDAIGIELKRNFSNSQKRSYVGNWKTTPTITIMSSLVLVESKIWMGGESLRISSISAIGA